MDPLQALTRAYFDALQRTLDAPPPPYAGGADAMTNTYLDDLQFVMDGSDGVVDVTGPDIIDLTDSDNS